MFELLTLCLTTPGELKTVMPHFRASVHTTHDVTWMCGVSHWEKRRCLFGTSSISWGSIFHVRGVNTENICLRLWLLVEISKDLPFVFEFTTFFEGAFHSSIVPFGERPQWGEGHAKCPTKSQGFGSKVAAWKTPSIPPPAMRWCVMPSFRWRNTRRVRMFRCKTRGCRVVRFLMSQWMMQGIASQTSFFVASFILGFFSYISL